LISPISTINLTPGNELAPVDFWGDPHRGATTGGLLGSVLAPAKILVGCSTVGSRRMKGEVMMRTLLFAGV
jgi:hypothetical protein